MLRLAYVTRGQNNVTAPVLVPHSISVPEPPAQAEDDGQAEAGASTSI